MHHMATIVAVPALLWETTKVSAVAPDKVMEGEDPAAARSAPYTNSSPYRSISNRSLGFVGLFRAVKLTSLNNNLNVFTVSSKQKSNKMQTAMAKARISSENKTFPASVRVPTRSHPAQYKHAKENQPKELFQNVIYLPDSSSL